MGDAKTPINEMREASIKLRRAAADAHGGPWAMSDVGIALIAADVQPYGAPCVADRLHEGDVRWMILVNPELAEPLASWLESEAAAHEELGVHPTLGPGRSARAALAVARVINNTEGARS
ncbi:hypothetical protein [Nonomuraea typhae]|uniref:Uncharacterized protein n=1 Tax=Nonomuraea typhae TaxID=2603600 RepID=A0ABW7YLS7_9ACTN